MNSCDRSSTRRCRRRVRADAMQRITACGTRPRSSWSRPTGGRAREAGYVLCVKDHHPKLTEWILLTQAGVGGSLSEETRSETSTTGHCRNEVRRCWAFDAIDRLYKAERWQDLKSFAIFEGESTVGGRTTCERRYYISSLPADAESLAKPLEAIGRSSIEQQLQRPLRQF